MANSSAADWLISVDDHVIEPPKVWTDRLPAKYQDVGPRMVGSPGGELWLYEDKRVATLAMSVAAGHDTDFISPNPVHFKDMRPGCYDPVARVADMDRAGHPRVAVLPVASRASAARSSTRPRTRSSPCCCVQAYNDWMIDEWCAAAPGRLIPMVLIPLWDPRCAATEIERCAAKGATRVRLLREPRPARAAVDP